MMRLLERRNILLSILVGSAVLLCGCMKVGPDYVRPPTSVSPNWLEERDERVKSEPAQYRAWWEAFNDPVLNRIIDQAYRENLTLKIAGVRVLEARAQLGIAVGDLYPQTQQAAGSLLFNRTSERSIQAVSGQAAAGQATGGRTGWRGNSRDDDLQPQPQPQPGAQQGIEFSFWRDEVSVSTAWEIDFWGKFRRAVESADAALLAAVADYDSGLVSLTADVANSYVQIRVLQKRIEIARQNVETQKESLQIAEVRFNGGLTSQRDVEQAKTVLFNTRATIPTLEAQLRQAGNALSVLLGLPPSNLEDILDGATDIPAPPPRVAVGIPADLLRRRPDVRSAELQAVAQSARIGVAKADLLPAFSLTGSFGFLSTDVGRFELSDIADWRARTASFGPGFQWNILNYGRIMNNVRVQDAQFQELLITYQNTVLRAQQEVEDSLAGFLRFQENAEYLAKSVDAAQKSLDLAVIQYQQGIADFTTVLTAQQALLTAQDSLATALGNISGNLVGVYRALGGGWEIRTGQDLVSPEVKEAMAQRTNWGKLLAPAVYMPVASEPGPSVRWPDW
jgi:NodT family efflux transporter outer membrane factor (OMF) lipoprotein